MALRPASTIRSRRLLSCWILCGVLPIPRTPTRIACLLAHPRRPGRAALWLVRYGLAAAGPAVVGADRDGLARNPAGGADGRRRAGHLQRLGDPLAPTVAECAHGLPG